MDITQAPGYSSGDGFGRTAVLSLEDIITNDKIIRDILKSQPDSFEPFLTEDEVIERLRCGLFQAWFYEVSEFGIVSMTITSMQYYSEKVKSLKIEFLQVRNFFSLEPMLEAVEFKARQMGFQYIEAVAHHVIARYGVTKKGFAATGVYIRKAIGNERIH